MVCVRLYSLFFVFKQIIQVSDKNTEFAMVFFDRNLLTQHQHAFAFFNSHGGTPCLVLHAIAAPFSRLFGWCCRRL